MTNQTRRLIVRVSPALLDKLDTFSKQLHLNKSEYVRLVLSSSKVYLEMCKERLK